MQKSSNDTEMNTIRELNPAEVNAVAGGATNPFSSPGGNATIGIRDNWHCYFRPV
ncbi:hypothetical protein [Lysobacter sp. GCM10012299]|uniref:hypothetical protein n=1 Tax=Lysobacter sp. GCM10012299 TaxID=3317333 RepID=UPI003624415C